MTRRIALPAKILLLGLCNLALLVVAGAIYLNLQLGSGAESVLLGPASDKMMGIVMRLTRQLDFAPESDWDELLKRLGAQYGARAYLTDPLGNHLAGPREILPSSVRVRFRAGPPGEGPPPPLRRAGEKKGPPKGLRPDRPPPPVFLVTTGNPTRYWVGGRLRVPGTPEGGMLVLEANSMFNPALFFDLRLIGSVCLAVAALSFLCWFSFVRRLTRSIRQMDSATERIAEGQFDTLVPVDRGDELGHLGSQINRMAARLAILVTGQKRFLGDIAHELCAPIARMQMAVGILEQRASDDTAHQSLADLREEVELISELVNELLQFSKAAIRPGAVHVEPLDVAAVASRVAAREAVPGMRIDVAIAPELRVLANEICFTRSLSNLVRNSIRYAGHAGPVEVSARPDGDQIVIVVADSGPGVAEDDLQRILEPFYRTEGSRNRNSGGVGLGLAIVKTGIESCQGSVVCRNRTPSGLEVTIRLPAPPA